MKTKESIIIVAIVVFVVIAGFIVSANYSGKDKEGSSDNGDSLLKEITYSEYAELLKSDEAVIIYVGRPTCSACTTYLPRLTEVIEENNLLIYYLNTDELSNDELQLVATSTEYFSAGGIRTPHTMVIKNKTVADTLIGAANKENIISFFQENGFI